MSTEGPVAIVTGGSRGLGRASALALLTHGWRVVVAARDAERLAHVASFDDPRIVTVVGSLADEDLAERCIDAARSAFGRVDGAVISVGGPPPGSVLTTSDDVWRAAFETVFLGSVRFARTLCAVLPEGGAIAFVLSTSAREAVPGLSTSNGLRPGLAMLVKDLADEVGPRGIRVVGLLPGRIDTERVRILDEAAGAGSRERMEAHIPLRRYGRPEEFGEVAAFVLGPGASYLTGCLIPVDGGSLRSP